MEWRVAEGVNLVPAPDLHRPELRVLKGIPVDIALTPECCVGPGQQLEVIGHRVLAKPVDVLVVGDAGLAHRAPDLDRPFVQAEVVVNPVKAAGGDLFGVVAELFKGADGRVASELSALGALRLEHPQVFGRHIHIGMAGKRPQQHAAPGVEGDAAGDVGVPGDEIHHAAHLGLRGRVGPGAQLFKLLAPLRRKIAVQVQALGIAVDLDHEAIVITHRALGQEAVIGATHLGWLARHHQAWLVWVALPVAVGVRNPHRQNAAVTIHIAGVQALHRLLVVGIGPGRRADDFGRVLHGPLGTVRVHAGANVESPGVQAAGDGLTLAVVAGQGVNQVQSSGATGELTGMDIGVHPVGRLIGRRAAGLVGHSEHPDVTALMAFAGALHRQQLRVVPHQLVQDGREFVKAVIAVVGNWHGVLAAKVGGRAGRWEGWLEGTLGRRVFVVAQATATQAPRVG